MSEVDFRIDPAWRYACQKHGDIGGSIVTVVTRQPNQPACQFVYCAMCYNEMIDKSCKSAVRQ